jgi:tetratricopeptide (TPR) repeat protein
MLRLGYMRTAADLLGMAGADEATHRFSPGAAVEELAVLVRRRHDARVLEERALEVARDASYPARVRFTMANFVVVRNGRRGSDTPAIHEAADLALATVAELDAGPFVTNLATQTVYRAIAFVPFVSGDCARTLELLDRAEAHQFAAQRAAADPLQRLAWVDHAFPLYETIAKTHLRLGDLARSLAATDKLAELSPNDPRGWDLRGQVLVRAGRLDEAIAAYARSIPVGGLPVARAAFFLGWIHQQLGQSEEALRYYRMSRQIDPTAPVLDDLIATVSG